MQHQQPGKILHSKRWVPLLWVREWEWVGILQNSCVSLFSHDNERNQAVHPDATAQVHEIRYEDSPRQNLKELKVCSWWVLFVSVIMVLSEYSIFVFLCTSYCRDRNSASEAGCLNWLHSLSFLVRLLPAWWCSKIVGVFPLLLPPSFSTFLPPTSLPRRGYLRQPPPLSLSLTSCPLRTQYYKLQKFIM
jgi:hypothetical protein